MSGNYLVVNADGPETRIALVENGHVAELFVERKAERGIVGSVYKGRVVRVLPGMGAAFVDIGIEKAAFLYVADVIGGEAARRRAGELFGTADDDGDGDEEKTPPPALVERPPGKKIEELLREGQEILVQVAKEPLGTKGARVTAHISLPGRHLVFMPTVDHVGISRRIASDKERKRLKDIVESHCPEGAGFIVRTAAEGATEADLVADVGFLRKVWADLQQRIGGVKPPALVYSDLDIILKTVRDTLTEKVERLVVDSPEEHGRIKAFAETFMPQYAARIELYKGDSGIFDEFGIEPEIGRALEKRVWLKSGGYIVIDHSEALTAIDVNTGRFVGKRDLEETITKNNLEAVREVADQLRLRNLGGLIVVDFIDMDEEANRDKVFKALSLALSTDRAKCNVSRISELGLLEMTRKRTRESLVKILTEPCPYCTGRGYVRSRNTIAYDILRALARVGAKSKEATLTVTCHPDVAELLATSELEYVHALEERLGKTITVRADLSLHLEQYELMGRRTGPAGGGATRTRP